MKENDAASEVLICEECFVTGQWFVGCCLDVGANDALTKTPLVNR
jgi:hypothetical protein